MTSDAKKELGVGIFFLILSVAYMIGTTTISTFTPFGNRGLDSRSVPLLIGFLTFILATSQIVVVLIKERRLRRLASEQIGTGHDEAHKVHDPEMVAGGDVPRGSIIARIDNVVPVKLVLSIAFLVIFVAAYRRAGFILSSTFFLMAESFLLVKAEDRRRWARFIVLFSIGASVIIYFLFTRYLSLFLPRGILG